MSREAAIPVRYGVALGKAHPSFHLELTLEAEKLGLESVWMPEHLIFPTAMAGSPYPGQEHPPVPPTTPVFDAFAYLSFLAGRTEHVKLGTHVYLDLRVKVEPRWSETEAGLRKVGL